MGALRYGSPKRKRAIYLTDTSYGHLVDLAKAANLAPSEICEQIIRRDIAASVRGPAIPIQTSLL